MLKKDLMDDNILYKFVKLDLVQFATFEENYSKEDKTVSINSGFQFAYNADKRVMRCNTIIELLQGKNTFMKVELASFFEIKEESLNLLIKDSTLVLSKEILSQFASFGYGALRGIIYLKTINTPFSDIILPPIILQQIFKESLRIKLDK